MMCLREFCRKAAPNQSEFLPTAGCSLVMQMAMKELGGDVMTLLQQQRTYQI